MFTEGPRRSYMQEAACLAMMLLDVEANIPEEMLPVSWVNFRQAWLYETANAKTIKEVAHALLDLEDGVQILNDRRTQSLKDHAAWRKTVAGIHTYDLLAKYVKLFKLDVQQIMMNSFSNQSTGGIHNDHGLEKRKYFPETQSNKLHTTDGNVHSSFRPHDNDNNSGQRDTRPVALEVLPLSSKCPDKEIVPESIYLIGQEFLPPDAPATLKFMRAVLVAEKTRFNVTVKFPGMTSLQSYFGRAPEPANDQVRGTTKLSLVLDQAKKETCMGTKPDLDGHYNMTPKLAERVLIRRVSCTEYLHQGHLWSFWIMEDFEQTQSKRFSRDKEATDDDDNQLEDDAKGEIGAAEALTQLIPGNSMIVTPEGNRAVNERSGKFSTEGPLTSQIKWGIRSLRRASFGNRSGSGSSPNSGDTGTKDANKDRRKTFSRKTLDFLDEQHQNIGQTTKSSDFLLSERSGRTHSRREEKLIDLVAVKCPGTSGKCVNSKHIRSNTILKLPKDMKGRWASERYKSAQLKLIEIMHKRGAVPGKPILRPALREEARKDIGDTGLLDHLLKHMTDTVVTNGERFRRRHNAEGAMEYWLEDASLMEIRKAAGIEDPSWIPPSGWKPGDALPGRGECGYGCLNRRMTPVEAAEMKKLKGMVDKVRSDLRSLNSRVRRWRSREVTPEQTEGLRDDKHDTSTEIDQALIQSNSEFQEERRNEVEDGTSTCKILTVQAKSQLETDLSEVQSSVVLMQEYIKCTMEGLGLSQEENIKRTVREVNSTDVMNVCPFSAPDATWAPVVGPLGIDLDSRSVLAKTSASAEINLRICSEESGRSTHEEVDFASSVGNEPKRPRLLQSSSGHNSASPNGFKASQPSASGRIVQPEMIVPHTRARDSYAELERKLDTMVPNNLLAFLANTSSCLGHKAETSREDASARVIQSITGSDNKSQFRPYFQHRINCFSPSTDTEVDRDNQNTVYPDQRPEGNRVKWATGSEGRDFQATEFHQSNFQSESRASPDVGLEAAQARDGLAILSFVADVEAIAKTSQEHAKAQDIQGVSQNQVSAIKNLKGCSSSAAGPTRGHSPAVTIHPEIRKRRMLQQVDTDHLSMMSSVTCSGCDTDGDSPAQFDRRGSLKASAPVTNGPFDETRSKPIQNSTSRPEHLMLTAGSKETPIVHMAKDLSINLSLTSHIPPGLSNNSSQCNSLQYIRGSVAEPSSTLTLSRLPGANAGGIYGHTYTTHNSSEQLESLQQVAGHSQDQPRALSKKNLLKEVRSTIQKSFPDIVGEKCSTQSSINKARSSTWLGLAPPTSSNSHS